MIKIILNKNLILNNGFKKMLNIVIPLKKFKKQKIF